MFLNIIDPHLQTISAALDADREYRACTNNVSIKFNLTVDDGSTAQQERHLTVDIVNGGTRIYSYSSSPKTEVSFELAAYGNQWNEVFQPVPNPPYQSFWGMLRTIGPDNGVRVLGDMAAFARYARVWRLALDIMRTAVSSKSTSPAAGGPGPGSDGVADSDLDVSEDHITGRYIHTHTPLYGRARVFVESAGHGDRPILFLHTAGSDSRQYHAVMNTTSLHSRFTMHAFDLPGHGRSDLGTTQMIGDLTLDEETYISLIRQVMVKLSSSSSSSSTTTTQTYQKPSSMPWIVSGASMAGQICLAVSLRARSLNVFGVIPCEGCEHIPRAPAIYSYPTGAEDESILNPETVSGMMSPTSPARHRREVWWGYSSQGTGIFKGDLKFYFTGWDGRGRWSQVQCPVYMLNGEYDYSCTPQMGERTFQEIQSALKDVGEDQDRWVRFEVMKGLGHFPASEDPDRFLPYFERALKWIEEQASDGGR